MSSDAEDEDPDDDGLLFDAERVLRQLRAMAQAERRRHGLGVAVGPFEDGPPVTLLALVTDEWATTPDETLMRARAAGWLLEVLAAAGVSLGDLEREAVEWLVEDLDAPQIQVIGGWVARARQ